MWLMPAASTVASVASARSWLIEPSAAAPKIKRVESCPVRPNGATGRAAIPRPYARRTSGGSQAVTLLWHAYRTSGRDPAVDHPRRLWVGRLGNDSDIRARTLDIVSTRTRRTGRHVVGHAHRPHIR